MPQPFRRLSWILGAALLGAGAVAIAQDEGTYTSVGEWEIQDGTSMNMDGSRNLQADRRAGSTSFFYAALPGGERQVRIWRDDCTLPIPEDGSEPGTQSLWATSGPAETLAAARAAFAAVAAQHDGHCPVPAADLAAALGDFDPAFAALESRLAANPFPDALAWRRGTGMFSGRVEGPVRINYWPGGTEGGARLVMDVEPCGRGGARTFEAEFDAPDDRDQHVRAASAALQGLIGEAQRACGLDAQAPARLTAGFAEAIGEEWQMLRDMQRDAIECPRNDICNAM